MKNHFNQYAIHRPESLITYVDSAANCNFHQIFNQRGLSHRDNLIICRRDLLGGHYVTIVKHKTGFLLADDAGQFIFAIYADLNALIKDVEIFIASASFSIHSANFKGKKK